MEFQSYLHTYDANVYIYDVTLKKGSHQKLTMSDLHPAKQIAFRNHLFNGDLIGNMHIEKIGDDFWNKSFCEYLRSFEIRQCVRHCCKYFNSLTYSKPFSIWWKSKCIPLINKINSRKSLITQNNEEFVKYTFDDEYSREYFELKMPLNHNCTKWLDIYVQLRDFVAVQNAMLNEMKVGHSYCTSYCFDETCEAELSDNITYHIFSGYPLLLQVCKLDYVFLFEMMLIQLCKLNNKFNNKQDIYYHYKYNVTYQKSSPRFSSTLFRGVTPLYIAMKCHSYHIMKWLLQLPADSVHHNIKHDYKAEAIHAMLKTKTLIFDKSGHSCHQSTPISIAIASSTLVGPQKNIRAADMTQQLLDYTLATSCDNSLSSICGIADTLATAIKQKYYEMIYVLTDSKYQAVKVNDSNSFNALKLLIDELPNVVAVKLEIIVAAIERLVQRNNKELTAYLPVSLNEIVSLNPYAPNKWSTVYFHAYASAEYCATNEELINALGKRKDALSRIGNQSYQVQHIKIQYFKVFKAIIDKLMHNDKEIIIIHVREIVQWIKMISQWGHYKMLEYLYNIVAQLNSNQSAIIFNAIRKSFNDHATYVETCQALNLSTSMGSGYEQDYISIIVCLVNKFGIDITIRDKFGNYGTDFIPNLNQFQHLKNALMQKELMLQHQ